MAKNTYVRVSGFNTAEKWSQDVAADVAHELVKQRKGYGDHCADFEHKEELDRAGGSRSRSEGRRTRQSRTRSGVGTPPLNSANSSLLDWRSTLTLALRAVSKDSANGSLQCLDQHELGEFFLHGADEFPTYGSPFEHPQHRRSSALPYV
jgi:hypothetical protein